MRYVRMLLLGAGCLFGFGAGAAASPFATAQQTTAGAELSLDIWDWTPPAKDIRLFEEWVKDLRRIGFNRVELSVPWKVLEPEPGRYDLSWLRERARICREHGLAMRLRINSYYRKALPEWYEGDCWHDADGKVVGTRIPSIHDERFWSSYASLCTEIARELRGHDVLYNAFIGLHAELKYGNWWTYDPASLAVWRKSIASPRPAWLTRVVGEAADLPATPAVPAATAGVPDLTPASLAFIAFREWTWRRAVERFADAIRAGDPEARISSPLGESYRRESALMSNLDYWGCSRGSQQVVHSYDFALHPGSTPLWHAQATIAAFQGITGLPVTFEFDSPETLLRNGYTEEIQKALARTALGAGAGLKFANFSYFDRLPGQWPVVKSAGALASTKTTATIPSAAPRETVLLFFSKWANYCYREDTEWIHEAQFGWWKLLSDCGVPIRIVCEDNLDEDLSGYRALVLAFSPLDLMPKEDRTRLEKLALPVIADHLCIPPSRPEGGVNLQKGEGVSFAEVPGNRVVLGYALGYDYFHGELESCREAFRKAMTQVSSP